MGRNFGKSNNIRQNQIEFSKIQNPDSI